MMSNAFGMYRGEDLGLRNRSVLGAVRDQIWGSPADGDLAMPK